MNFNFFPEDGNTTRHRYFCNQYQTISYYISEDHTRDSFKIPINLDDVKTACPKSRDT